MRIFDWPWCAQWSWQYWWKDLIDRMSVLMLSRFPLQLCQRAGCKSFAITRESPAKISNTRSDVFPHPHISNKQFSLLSTETWHCFCDFNLCSESLSLRLKSSQRCECTVGVAGVPDNSQSSVKFPPIFLTNHNFFDSNHNFFDGNQFAVQLWWNIASTGVLDW